MGITGVIKIFIGGPGSFCFCIYILQEKISISRIVPSFLVSFKNRSFCFLWEDIAFILYSIISLCPSVDFNGFNFSHCELSSISNPC